MNKPTDSKRIGAVMVIGAGIAGMQAALDLRIQATRSPCRPLAVHRGLMAQLDKAFPTNDCAM
jgi:heterodisulfide reductase subunit A